jgi:hypothetical protein
VLRRHAQRRALSQIGRFPFSGDLQYNAYLLVHVFLLFSFQGKKKKKCSFGLQADSR